MSATNLPDGHMLVPTSDKLAAVVGIKLDAEDWQVTQVTEGQCPVLLPLEDLDGEYAVHSDCKDLLTIC